MNRLLHRVLAGALVTTFTVVSAAPCVAGDAASSRGASLTTLSQASVQVLTSTNVTAARKTQEPSAPSSPGSFFRSRKGAIALALVAGSIGFTVWAAHDSRKDVRSPVR